MKKKRRKFHRMSQAFFGLFEDSLRPLLDEYGLRLTDKDAGWGGYDFYTITFQNETTAVRVYFEWRDYYLEVMVCRLVDGKLGMFHETLPPDVPETCFHTQDVLSIRAPGYDLKALNMPEERGDAEATIREVGKRLALYADALRAHAGDILRGDFGLFPRLNLIAKRRARQTAAVEEQWDLEDYS